MRLFYAIDFPAHIKKSLTDNLSGIKKHISRANFTEENNFHVTMVFLGECEINQLEYLKKAADNTVAKLNISSFSQPKINAVIEKLGTFGRSGDEILWAGVKTNPENILQKINKTILEELELLGIKINDDKNKKFTPHVTIARRTEFSDISSNDLKQINFTPINFEIDSLTLMQSVRYERLVYEPVYEKKF